MTFISLLRFSVFICFKRIHDCLLKHCSDAALRSLPDNVNNLIHLVFSVIRPSDHLHLSDFPGSGMKSGL